MPTPSSRHRVARLLVAAALSSLAALLPGALAAQTWTSLGPEGGLVATLAVDPSDPALVWAGTTGGLYRSSDRGASWTLQSPGLSSPNGVTNLEPEVLVVHPLDPSVFYAAALSGGRDFTAGVFRSEDRGSTWRGVGFYGRSVLALALDPTTLGTLYAATGRIVYKSDDAGTTWSERSVGLAVSGAPSFLVTTLAVDPVRPSTVYAGTEPFSLLRSDDGGATWTSLEPGLPSYLLRRGGGVNAIVVDPADPDRVHVVANNTGVFTSPDAGATWRSALRAPVVNRLVLHPDGTLYAGGDSLFASGDGGRTWATLDAGLPPSFQVRSLALDPGDSAVVYAGDSQGLGVLRSGDGGATWKPRRHGMTNTIVYAVVREGGRIYAATNRGIYRRADGARTWRRVDAGLAGPAFALAVDPESGATLYAGTPGGVYRSRDRGRSWKAMNAGAAGFVRALAVDPSQPAVVYAGAMDFGSLGGVYKTTDRGRSWSRGIDGLTDRHVAVLAVADPSTIYAGTIGGGGVFKSVDAGATWSARNDGLPTTAGFFAIHALAVDPTAPSTLYAGVFREGIYKSVDGGETWFRVILGLTDGEVRALAIDPSAPSTVYAGTYFHGVFRSTDAGKFWQSFNPGLASQSISTLVIGDDGVVLAGTENGGVHRLVP